MTADISQLGSYHLVTRVSFKNAREIPPHPAPDPAAASPLTRNEAQSPRGGLWRSAQLAPTSVSDLGAHLSSSC